MTTTDGDACVIDTNVLVYSTVAGNPWYQQARRWLSRLQDTHQIRGKQIHDANIVAVMLTHGIYRLVTYNQADFGRFDEISLETAVVGDAK